MLESDFPRDYVALDLETTGFYPNSCRITEIGAVRVSDGTITDRFQELVNPGMPIPAQVVRLTGITDDMVADCDPIDMVLPRFLDWLAPLPGTVASDIVPVVGHNVGFDLRFLDHAARRVGANNGGFACVDYDTMQISRTLFPNQRKHRLADLIQRFHIADVEEHRALSDAIQTHQCFEWMRNWTLDQAGLFGGEIHWASVPATDGTPTIQQRLQLA